MSKAHRFAHPRFATLISVPAILAGLLLVPHPGFAEALCPFILGDDTEGVVSGDFNGDGLADVAVSSGPIPIPPVVDVPKISIFLGSSVGAPARAAGTILTSDEVGGLSVGDMNEDGKLDLIALVGTPPGPVWIRILPGDGLGGFSLGEKFLVTRVGINVGDFDGDGHLDLAGGSDGISVVFGDGLGHLGPEQPVVTRKIYGVLTGDLNGDGRADIVGIPNDDFTTTKEPLLTFLGNPDRTFTALPPQQTDYDLLAGALGDVNEDGHLDVVASASRPFLGNVLNVATFLGRGDGTFITASAPAAHGGVFMVRLGDVDGDSHLDVLTFSPDATLTLCAPGTQLYFHHGSGTGAFADGVPTEWLTNHSNMTLGDMNGDGFADAALPSCGAFTVRPGTPGGIGDLVNAGRAFPGKNGDAIKLNANKPSWCAYLEGVDGSFDVGPPGYSPHNIMLVSPGTGSVTSVLSNSKERIVGDYDQNGVQDLLVCFPKDQLRLLFSSLVTTQAVNVSIEGTIGPNGCRLRAPLTITVIPGGVGQAAARMNPNVFTTTSVLSFETPRGQVRARIYDVSGRLVKTLMDGAAEAGPQRVRVEARDGNGKALPSGVYFFRIDSPSGPESGRFVIAR
jgi:hypothetical protein